MILVRTPAFNHSSSTQRHTQGYRPYSNVSPPSRLQPNKALTLRDPISYSTRKSALENVIGSVIESASAPQLEKLKSSPPPVRQEHPNKPVLDLLNREFGEEKVLEITQSTHQKSLIKNKIQQANANNVEWNLHCIIKSFVDHKLGSGDSCHEYKRLRFEMSMEIFFDEPFTNDIATLDTAVGNNQSTTAARKAILSLAENKGRYTQLLMLSHFRNEPRLILDPLFHKLIHRKNLENNHQVCALIETLEEWQAFAPTSDSFSQSLKTYFSLDDKPSRKSLFYATFELAYCVKHRTPPKTITPPKATTVPTEARAAFYHWANEMYKGSSQHALEAQFLIALTENNVLLGFRLKAQQNALTTDQMSQWNKAITVDTPCRTPGWHQKNTSDPMEILKSSRYTQSCLNVYRDQSSHQYHLGRFLNPLNRQLQVFDRNAFVGRALIRVMPDWDKNSYLYLDKAYFSDESETARNCTCTLELINAAREISRALEIPLVIDTLTLDKIDTEIWRVVGQQTLKSPALEYPDYFDGEIRQHTRPQRGRMNTGETPYVKGILDPFSLLDFDIDTFLPSRLPS